jgi:hypothetical protein
MSKYIEKDADNIHEIIPQIKKDSHPELLRINQLKKKNYFEYLKLHAGHHQHEMCNPGVFWLG